jgi:DNA-binding Xre family transcriptional regulator
MPLRCLLREKRLSKGLSLTEASQRLGISKGMLSEVERDSAHTTSRVIERACELYECQPGDLYEMVPGNEEQPETC